MAEQKEAQEPAGICTGAIAMFNSATAHSRILWEERDTWQPRQWTDCTLNDGATLQQVIDTQARHGEMMKESGFMDWSSHVFTPYLGFEPDWPYDYVQMNHWYTFEHRGVTANAWQAFLDAHREVQEENRALGSCQRDRSYAGRLVFSNGDRSAAFVFPKSLSVAAVGVDLGALKMGGVKILLPSDSPPCKPLL